MTNTKSKVDDKKSLTQLECDKLMGSYKAEGCYKRGFATVWMMIDKKAIYECLDKDYCQWQVPMSTCKFCAYSPVFEKNINIGEG